MDLLAGPGQRGAAALRVRGGADARLPDRQASEPCEERHRRMTGSQIAGTFIGPHSPSRRGGGLVQSKSQLPEASSTGRGLDELDHLHSLDSAELRDELLKPGCGSFRDED